MRKVGGESRRTYQKKLNEGFFSKYMSGQGIELGSQGYETDVVPILDTATPYNLDTLGYDGLTLPIESNTQDFVYSSHVLEHIENYQSTIQEWYRVLKIGGHMVIVVPHKFLYEKKNNLPSKWNGDHRRFYTPASLLAEIEENLLPNSYRIRLLEDGDQNFNYSLGPNMHSDGAYEITLVLEKISIPDWSME